MIDSMASWVSDLAIIQTMCTLSLTVLRCCVLINAYCFTTLKGCMKEPNISIYFFFCPSLSDVLFPMFCLLVEREYQILLF